MQVRLSAQAVLCVAVLLGMARICLGQTKPPLPVGRWITVSANLEGGYRRTQFSLPDYNTGVIQWDSRVEVWPPLFRKQRRWGPYVRVAGIAGSEPNAFQNGWLGAPGLGIQGYPFKGFLGPTRMFADYNFTRYWGEDFSGQGTSWRPKNQTRAGFDYWKAANVNSADKNWWMELWNGLYWQSGNEFTDRYDSVLFANSGRVGLRAPKSGVKSTITPYVALESSLSKYRRSGTKGCFFVPDSNSRDPGNPCDFFWENRLLAGGGLRFAPSLTGLKSQKQGALSRLVIYGEYLNTATYYGPKPPSSFPRFDILVGVSANVGNWYK